LYFCTSKAGKLSTEEHFGGQVLGFGDSFVIILPDLQLKASYTSSLRPHTQVLGFGDSFVIILPDLQLKASYTSSLRPHALVA
jgi:hypothetical protein